MSKTPIQQNFPEFNRFLFRCSLQTYVNNQEKFFLYLSAQLIFKSSWISDAISTADSHKCFRVFKQISPVIDRRITSSSLITLATAPCSLNFFYFIEIEVKKQQDS